MLLTDWLSLSGDAAHFLTKFFLPKTSFNHPSVLWNNLLGCRLCMHGLKYEGNAVEENNSYVVFI
jgi:hypothetical protein